jgi:hypothetical protein
MLLSLIFMLTQQGRIQAHDIIVIQRIILSLLGCLALTAFGMQKFVTALISFRRIAIFLNQPERPHEVLKASSIPTVRICGSFTFMESKSPVLQGLDR